MYTIESVIRSGAGSEASVTWYRGDDLARAMVAFGQACLHDDTEGSGLPDAMRFTVASVTMRRD